VELEVLVAVAVGCGGFKICPGTLAFGDAGFPVVIGTALSLTEENLPLPLPLVLVLMVLMLLVLELPLGMRAFCKFD
jgi:hypothetical protein